MAAPIEQNHPCPKCGNKTEIIDRKVNFRMKQQSDGTADKQVPESTAYTLRCVKDGCGHMFTRTVKHAG